MNRTLQFATYNIHKGFSHFNYRMALHDLREKLHGMRPDVLFLQEVLGIHERHAERYDDWPKQPQYEFIADSVWPEFAYGKNAVYPEGHHGNAILSRFPILSWENEDISAHRFENRGLLHCEIAVPGWDQPLHCVNVHLALFERGRRKQLTWLRERIERMVPDNAPLIIAGDFNDWRSQACDSLCLPLGMQEVFTEVNGQPARSYPAALPVFRLDRIYARGFRIRHAEVFHGRSWSRISDHAALAATMTRV